jgi:hypothetical protein
MDKKNKEDSKKIATELLGKKSTDEEVLSYAKKKGLDPVSFLRGWKSVKNRENYEK